MNLVILDWTDNSIEVVRDVPDILEGDDDALYKFIIDKTNRFIDNIQYMLVDDTNALVYSTYTEDGTIVRDAVDCFGEHF